MSTPTSNTSSTNKEETEAPVTMRVKVVQLLHTLNVLLIFLTSLGFIFFTETMVPGVNEASKTAVRVAGGYGLMYGLLIRSRGPQDHGAYCVTFVLHFTLALIYAFDAVQLGMDNNVRALGPAVLHFAMFALMIGIVTNGGLGGKKHEKKQ